MSASTLDHFSLSSPLAKSINLLTLACWPVAGFVFALHVTNTEFVSARSFDEIACWLVAIGCCGCPAFALRALGRLMTPRACLLVSALAFGAALLFASFDATGYIHPTPSNRLIALVLMLAIAIQSLNGADLTYARERQEARHRAEIAQLNQSWQQAVARARVNHLESCAVHAAQESRRLAELVDAVSGLTDAEAGVLGRALAHRQVPQSRDEPEAGSSSRVVPFERTNGHHRN